MRIFDRALAVGVGEASVDEIDLINIRQATHLAMARAVRALALAADFALVDGNDPPALPCPCDTIVDGDARSASIAAASIIAKVTRDRMMRALHEHFPGYGWFNNKGYSTEEHLTALARLGPCIHHRRRNHRTGKRAAAGFVDTGNRAGARLEKARFENVVRHRARA